MQVPVWFDAMCTHPPLFVPSRKRRIPNLGAYGLNPPPNKAIAFNFVNRIETDGLSVFPEDRLRTLLHERKPGTQGLDGAKVWTACVLGVYMTVYYVLTPVAELFETTLIAHPTVRQVRLRRPAGAR